MSNSNKDVEIFYRVNKLRLKAGIGLNEEVEGVVDPEGIKKAQGIINEREQEYPVEVSSLLADLEQNWQALKKGDEAERARIIKIIHNSANQIKDLTATYHHNLMHYFALSLRDFCESININKTEHHTIVQAHLDVMNVTFDKKLKATDTDAAKELKKMLRVAIEKYS